MLECRVFHQNEYVDFGLVMIFFAGFFWAIKYLYQEIMWLIWRMKHVFIWNPQWRRGERLLEAARNIGPIWVTNTQNGITGICLYQDFMFTLQKEIDRLVSEGKIREIIRAEVLFSTFTFAENLARMMPIHTGDKKSGKSLMLCLVEEWMECKRSKIPSKLFSKIADALIIEDPRLYVPYSSNSSRQHELDEASFGNTTIENARAVLGVLHQHS